MIGDLIVVLLLIASILLLLILRTLWRIENELADLSETVWRATNGGERIVP